MRTETLVTSMVLLQLLALPVGCSSSGPRSSSSSTTAGTSGSGGSSSGDGSSGGLTGGSSTGAGSNGTSTGSGTGTSACLDLATALCGLQNSCSNGFLVARNWGNLSTCISLQEQECLLSISAPSSSRDPAKVEACAQAYPGISCGNLFAGILPTACVPGAGGLPNGAACTFSGQCGSTNCELPSNGTVCGSCQPLPDAGVSCATFDCPRGLVCGKSGVCLVPVGDGGSCLDANQCFFDLVCEGLNASTETPGACLPAATTVGASCDPQALIAPSCAGRLGLQCNSRLKTCAATLLVDAGEPCGAIDAGPRPCPDGGEVCVVNGQINCLGGGVCVEDNGAASCLAGAMPGQACDLSAGPACISPASCVVDAGTGGLCRLSDPSLCGL